jgi:hypothetical protein
MIDQVVMDLYPLSPFKTAVKVDCLCGVETAQNYFFTFGPKQKAEITALAKRKSTLFKAEIGRVRK